MTFSVVRTLLITVIILIVYLMGYQYGDKHRNKDIKKASVIFIICLLFMCFLNIIYKGKVTSIGGLLMVLITLIIVTIAYFIYILLIALKQNRIENKIKDTYYKKKTNRDKDIRTQREEIITLIKADRLFNKYNSIIISVLLYTFLYLLVFLLIF